MTPHKCPECGSTHDTPGGLAKHIEMTQDDNHPDEYIDCYRIVLDQYENDDLEPPDDTDDQIDTGAKLNPEMPGGNDDPPTDTPTPEPDTVDCPNCSTELNHSEQEIAQFIDDHGAAYCDECGHVLKVEQ